MKDWQYDDKEQSSLFSSIQAVKSSTRSTDQKQMVESQSPLFLIHEAMEILKRCKRLIITDSTPSQDVYGSEYDARRPMIGPLTFESRASVEFVSKALSVILESAASSRFGKDLTTKPRLRLLIINIGMSYNSMDCNGIRPDMLPDLPATIPSLRQLRITFDCNPFQPLEVSHQGASLARFLEAMPNLRRLEILVVGEDWAHMPFQLLHYITVPKLKKLRLECLKCDEKGLVEFLQRHEETLTYIKFDVVHLDDKCRSWNEIIHKIKSGPNDPTIVFTECEPEGGTIDKYQISAAREHRSRNARSARGKGRSRGFWRGRSAG
ncbi:hypothetical protein FHETE_7251 [Fusarium heterosporum]|uniref:Uncharacterized protein n=1 Tax=Fusarium heterosporum TaxID=42747 RepID=A0A8H5T8D6_FUSHE|nr:hypothetical protein FHETE_7251 [Fusarium heterosporum]